LSASFPKIAIITACCCWIAFVEEFVVADAVVAGLMSLSVALDVDS